ncbi:MAG: hypothetical protein V4529_16505 [Gemmatimonadota bacterium]
MSEEKRVKGWAVKYVPCNGCAPQCGHVELWLGHHEDGLAKDQKSGRGVWANRAVPVRWIRNRRPRIACGRYILVRIVGIAKPKAPKPDKLEQAIAKAKELAREAEGTQTIAIGQRNWASAQWWDGHIQAARIMVRALEALR